MDKQYFLNALMILVRPFLIGLMAHCLQEKGKRSFAASFVFFAAVLFLEAELFVRFTPPNGYIAIHQESDLKVRLEKEGVIVVAGQLSSADGRNLVFTGEGQEKRLEAYEISKPLPRGTRAIRFEECTQLDIVKKVKVIAPTDPPEESEKK